MPMIWRWGVCSANQPRKRASTAGSGASVRGSLPCGSTPMVQTRSLITWPKSRDSRLFSMSARRSDAIMQGAGPAADAGRRRPELPDAGADGGHEHQRPLHPGGRARPLWRLRRKRLLHRRCARTPARRSQLGLLRYGSACEGGAFIPQATGRAGFPMPRRDARGCREKCCGLDAQRERQTSDAIPPRRPALPATIPSIRVAGSNSARALPAPTLRGASKNSWG